MGPRHAREEGLEDKMSFVFHIRGGGDRFKYEWLFPISNPDGALFYSLQPSDYILDWRSVSVGWKACMGEYDEDDTPPPTGLKRPEIARVTVESPAFSRRAIECLEPLIRGHAQVLPLTVANGEEMYVLQVLTVVDGQLDEARCEAMRVGVQKQLVVSKFALFNLPNGRSWPPIFRLGEVPKVHRFVNEDFRCVIVENKLTGAELTPVPINERPPIR